MKYIFFTKVFNAYLCPVVRFKFFVSRFYYRSCILSASSVSTNGTSISSNANRFAVLIKFPETVLKNRCERLNPTTAYAYLSAQAEKKKNKKKTRHYIALAGKQKEITVKNYGFTYTKKTAG